MSFPFLLGDSIDATLTLYNSARSSFSRAQLSSRRAEAAARARERQLLSNNPSDQLAPRRQADTRNDAAISASGDVTAALLRTRNQLATNVERSHLAQETLEQSSRDLQSLSTQYDDLNSLLAQSRGLLKTLLSNKKTDTWYLESAFYILIATIAWLVFRRFLYGPLWWLVWLPIKLLWRTSIGVLGLTRVLSATKLPSVVESPISGSASAPTGIMSGSQQSASIQGDPPHASAAAEKEDPSAKGSLSQKVGQLADKLRGEGAAKEAQPVVRGDGTVLQDSDAPRNPYKRMFDTDVENARQKAAEKAKEKDEL
jgi:protein transport protein SEC20